MRWSNTSSGFVLRRMARLLSDGSRPDKVFKDKDVNMVVRHLKEFTGEIVSSTQVYNHLRKWRQKWSKVSKLKDLSGALWDSDIDAIMLDGEHYAGHIKVCAVYLALFTYTFDPYGNSLMLLSLCADPP
jgi:methionine salvage enolase-phosphatase E1